MVHKITFVIIVCAVALTYGQTISEQPQPEPTTPSPNTTTTEPTTTTATTKPTTPTTPTTTPTTIPTNSTTPTTPTTTPPYPQPTTPTTKPTPTTPTPTPTPSPKPPQKPDVGKWNVTDHTTNKTCILVDMAIQLNISYIGNDNKTKHRIVNVPKDADASGSCGDTIQGLELEWNEHNISFGQLNLTFLRNESTHHFWISVINLAVKPDHNIFPDIKDKNDSIVLIMEKEEFSTSINKSYLCGKEQSFVLKKENDINETNSEMLVSHVQLEAFITGKNAKFGAAEDCEPSSSPDIVPIAVGCALVGLVAIVLIAYLVGRRRSQARGYLSM